jgi:ribonuclease HI
MIKQFPDADVTKGKMVLDQSQGFMKQRKPGDGRKQARQKWEPPRENVVKLNVDGAFSCDDPAGVGMIGRDHQGVVVFAACRPLRHCKDATEAEVAAIEEGMRLALQWTQLSFIIESDCSEAVELINGAAPNISAYAFRVNLIRDMLRERESKLVKISREANRASHELAQLGRIQVRLNSGLVFLPRQLWEH